MFCVKVYCSLSYLQRKILSTALPPSKYYPAHLLLKHAHAYGFKTFQY